MNPVNVHVLAAGEVLAKESQKSGPIGLAVILILCVVCYFLFKSMSKHLRKVQGQWPDTEPTDTAPAAADPQPDA